ncbi:helix-turn-helix domain-containing protein [Bacillus sp. DJP31]|uniref:helix-turn-helix domain-containing protein n=1 Tax=Bacillus sp. DJP31 TaxID=3409789 RepID=UPI003BB7DF6E
MTELGQRLKQAREDKGFSLEDLQSITKIQKRYLQCVEDGNYDILPGIFYARAFVKQYAEAVGLDPERVFEEYKNDIPSTPKEAIPEQLSRVKRTRAEVNTTDSKVLQFLPRILVIVVLLGLALTVWTVAQKNDSFGQVKEQPKTDTASELEMNSTDPFQSTSPNEVDEDTTASSDAKEDEETTLAEEVKSVQQIELVETSGRKSTYKLTNTAQFLVDVSTTGETWIAMKNGKNKTFFSGSLTANAEDATPVNSSYDYVNETEAVIKLGNAMASIVKINGQVLEIPSEPKSVQDITILFEKGTEQ